MSAVLELDTSSLDAAASGVIWGNVWFDFEGTAFPESRWRDLAVVVVADAVDVVRSMKRGDRHRQIGFYDGPFKVELSSFGEESVRVSFGRGRSVVYSPVEFAEFVTQVEQAARELVIACKENGWGDQHDVRGLDSMLSRG